MIYLIYFSNEDSTGTLESFLKSLLEKNDVRHLWSCAEIKAKKYLIGEFYVIKLSSFE